MWMKQLGCHADLPEVSRCRTKGEFEESVVRKCQSMKNEKIHPGFETGV